MIKKDKEMTKGIRGKDKDVNDKGEAKGGLRRQMTERTKRQNKER